MLGRCLLLAALACSAAAFTDPETDMTAPEIIAFWGYTAESVTATTEDGYILTMHRIPYGKNGPDGTCRPVVFLQHGLECDSTNWIINLPEESLGFILADAGFDVWLGNMRGNTYGKAHKNLNPKKEEFWEFSWDEMSKYDLQAMIDTVLKVTGQESLYYAGHSQGTLTMFSKLSQDPAFASKIKQFHALAPVGTVKHIRGLLDIMAKYLLPEFELWDDIFGSGEFLPSGVITDELAKIFCDHIIMDVLCSDIMFMIAGPETDQFNVTRSGVYVAHTPAGTSLQNMIHWAQMVKSGRVDMYDYGSSKKNKKHYGQSNPPVYDFATIKTDMYLYWSKDDWLATETDIKEYLIPTLNPAYVKENNEVINYNHLDFIWGLNAPVDIYEPMLKTMKQDMGGRVRCVNKAEEKVAAILAQNRVPVT